jgi:hypothetical protein
MCRVALAIFLSALSAATSFAAGEAAKGTDPLIGEFLQAEQAAYVQKLADVSNPNPVLLANGDFNDFPTFSGDMYSAEHRSVGRAFLLSFLVPGLGEYYAGSNLKAGIFLGFEVLTWTQYMSNHRSGTDKEDEFQAFANSHWSPTDYVVHLIENYNTIEDTLPGDKLPDTKTQQYYEMIGKYEKFWPAWDDYDAKTNTSKGQRKYMVMRDDANKKLDKARTWAMVALANHVLSAFDAALTAKRFNKKRDVFSEVNVKARLARYIDERIPQVVVTYVFF